jgi:RHH-type proline utilization regulon transcriptional repressor/proline dehydrogenase/delta 1-pyrroline-5-carboxylate dehydrogenase
MPDPLPPPFSPPYAPDDATIAGRLRHDARLGAEAEARVDRTRHPPDRGDPLAMPIGLGGIEDFLHA